MHLRTVGLILSVAALAQSRSLSADVPVSDSLSGAPARIIARIHWIGRGRLALRTNAASQMSIWNLPESAKLEAQTLDKLSVAPWRLAGLHPDPAAQSLLRPLLDDVVRRECYLEIRRAAVQPAQVVFAVRLDDRRAALWETNLSAVFRSLTGIPPAARAPRGWLLAKHHAPDLIECARAGEWTILALSQGTNALLGEIVSRIHRGGIPFETGASQDWLEAMVDLPRLSGALRQEWTVSPDWPNVSIALTGEGTNVHTRATFAFAHLPPIELEPWNLPFTMLDDPMAGFAAVRGFKSWLGSLKFWNDLQVGPPPNQLFLWSLWGMGMNSFGAAPLPGASNEVARITDLVMAKGGSWFETNELVKFKKSETYNGLDWQGLPWLSPSLQSVTATNGNFIFFGLFPNTPTSPPPPDYFDHALAATNLVYYGWELTSARTEQWLYVGQFVRFVSGKPQMPFHCASLEWLKAIGPKLGIGTTRITLAGPNTLSLDRTSTVGLTGIELHLLADWLESPRFPIGLHTLASPGTP